MRTSREGKGEDICPRGWELLKKLGKGEHTHICSMVALFGGAFLRLVGENQQKVGEKSYEGKSWLTQQLN